MGNLLILVIVFGFVFVYVFVFGDSPYVGEAEDKTHHTSDEQSRIELSILETNL